VLGDALFREAASRSLAYGGIAPCLQPGRILDAFNQRASAIFIQVLDAIWKECSRSTKASHGQMIRYLIAPEVYDVAVSTFRSVVLVFVFVFAKTFNNLGIVRRAWDRVVE
jgi:hypothetical protein